MQIDHDDRCDRETLGWTLLRVEEEQGPALCVTVSELRRAREEYRDAGQLPYCSCGERQLRELRGLIDKARKAGDEERYHELLAERRELAAQVTRSGC